MDYEREAKCSVKSLAFSHVYSIQEVWFFFFSYDQIRRHDNILAGFGMRATSRQLTFVWRDSKTFKDAVDWFICIWYKSVHKVVICRCRVNIGSLSGKHSAVDRMRMHNFEPKIEDLTGFNNKYYGDTLMKEELCTWVIFLVWGSCGRQVWYCSFDLSTLPCCMNARYAFRLIVYEYARLMINWACFFLMLGISPKSLLVFWLI